MKILGREIKVSYEQCPHCKKHNIIIEIHTKKWFKGKEVQLIE
jgi:hypothetical protein